MMVLFWGGLILLGVAAVRAWQRGPVKHEATTALDLLKARYARGELSREQYDEMRRDLAQ